jgi:hypothetical protein
MKGPLYKHDTAPTPTSTQDVNEPSAVRAACDSGYESGGRMKESTGLLRGEAASGRRSPIGAALITR